MANNFHTYYPHPDGKNPELAHLVDYYCDRLFSDAYCEENKLLDFGEGYTHLKSNVAGITAEMRQKNEKMLLESRKSMDQKNSHSLVDIL